MNQPRALLAFSEMPVHLMIERARDFEAVMKSRRTVRDFSSREVPREIIELALKTAGAAPSGANQQPWHFAVVSDATKKRKIREAAESEEREFYARRAPKEWLEALAPLETDAQKPYLETAPFLIGVFYETHGVSPNGDKEKRYYPMDSTGIATGFLIAALHQAGLATLTHTPSPMAFLNTIMERPDNERALVLLVVGYPAEGATVPAIERKSLAQIATFF
jgi:iodotyrosine deiodinase